MTETDQAEHIRTAYPYPIARAYAALDDPHASLQLKQEALYFTVYQLMRTLGLALLGQYLCSPPAADPAPLKDREKLAGAIARLRSPFFSDWESLLRTFAKSGRCERLGLDFMPGFRAAMAAIDDEAKTAPLAVPREYAVRDGAGRLVQRLDLWTAFRALRNHTAHSGQTADQVCREDLALFRAPLERLLGHFDFLADYELLVADADLARDETDLECVPLRLLRGAAAPEPLERDLTDDPALCEALGRSPVVLRAPDGRVQPLFPFCHGHLEGEPVRLLDGYYLKDAESESLRHTLYYLGDIRRLPLDDGEPVGYPAPCTAGAQLRRMLDAHRVQWHLKREDLALWSIRDSVNDYSRRTVAELGGSKYIPAAYLDRPSLSDPLWRLATADESDISTGRVRGAMLLVGRAGTGKSALLCDLTRRLLERADAGPGEGAEGPDLGPSLSQDLVLLLRGDALNRLPGANQLRANLEQKIGLDPASPTRQDLSDLLARGQAVDPAKTAIEDTQSIFTALDARRREDQVQGRRLVLLLDGLNEATDDARARVQEALELVELTRRYPWLRVVLALRHEFIAVWHARATGTESSPFARVLDCFEPPPEDPARLGELPAWRVPEFAETEAETVYARYQSGVGIPACTTPWTQIPPETRRGLLVRPLYLHLWMETFPDREAVPVSGEDALFRAYLDTSYRRFPDLRPSLAAVLERMLATGRSELDTDDDRELRAVWERQQTETERRLRFNPIETGLAAGILVRRTGADGAGFRIPFQRLREQMLFAHLLEQDPAIRPESLAGWIGLPHSQDLEGALSHIAGVLWDQGRYAELAPLICEADVPRRAWERMLAVRLVGDAPPTASQLRALAEGLADDGAKQWLARSLIWDVPDRVEGLAAESRRLVLFEMAREILAPLHEREPQRSDLARDLIGSYRLLGQSLHAQGDAAQALRRYEEALGLASDWLPRLRAAGALGPNEDLGTAHLTLLAAAAEGLSAGKAPLGWTVGPLHERPDWRPAPLIAGDRQAVSGSDGSAREQTGRSLAGLESALARLGLDLAGARVDGLRRLALPFYAGPGAARWTLAEVSLAHGGRTAAVALLAGPAGVIPLTGQGHAIFAANALFRPDLSTLENRLAYMRFLCGACRGEQRFLVIDGSDDLPWRDDADPALRAEAARLIRPLGLAVDAAGYPRPHGTVLYGTGLFTCNFQLDAQGMVYMTDDEPLMEGLPVRTETFDGPLRYEAG